MSKKLSTSSTKLPWNSAGFNSSGRTSPERASAIISVGIGCLCGDWGLGFGVQGSGFRVQGSGFRVQGSGFRFGVWGLGFGVVGLTVR